MKLNKLIIIGLAAAFLSSFVAAKPGGGKGKGERPPKRVFSEVDTDSDGKVSLEEFLVGAPNEERATKRFEKRDKDEDSFLSEEEFNAPKGKKGKKGKGKRKKGGDE